MLSCILRGVDSKENILASVVEFISLLNSIQNAENLKYKLAPVHFVVKIKYLI